MREGSLPDHVDRKIYRFVVRGDRVPDAAAVDSFVRLYSRKPYAGQVREVMEGYLRDKQQATKELRGEVPDDFTFSDDFIDGLVAQMNLNLASRREHHLARA